jgi:chloramphenicol-sensitive protein RarD
MNKGAASAALAYLMWGLFPVYFKFLTAVPAVQIVAHRIAWSVVLLFAIVAVRRELGEFRRSIDRRMLLTYLVAGTLLSANWMLYIYGVTSGQVVEASLGYFINPLFSMLLGVVFLRERLRPLQWAAAGLALVGVLYLTISLGRPPWLSLALAVTFGLYGLMKKTAPLSVLHGLTLETATIFLPALGYLVFVELNGTGAFIQAGWLVSLLLALCGVVTVIPLLFFATGSRQVPLSTMGILQYITPTLQFLAGVFLFGESFNGARLVGFCIIWFALAVFSAESFWMHRSVPSEAPV